MSLLALRIARLPGRSSLRSFSSTTTRLAEITLQVDGVSVSIEQGSSLIQACEKAGAYLVPPLCDPGEASATLWQFRAILFARRLTSLPQAPPSRDSATMIDSTSPETVGKSPPLPPRIR